MLTTVDAHRRRGLARWVLVDLVQQMIAAGHQAAHPLFCYVVETNVASRSLLRSAGFDEGGVFSWQGWELGGGGGDESG
jgi:hypothetical protein